jgi:hypothetical protein
VKFALNCTVAFAVGLYGGIRTLCPAQVGFQPRGTSVGPYTRDPLILDTGSRKIPSWVEV